jgi:hypothetical protein
MLPLSSITASSGSMCEQIGVLCTLREALNSQNLITTSDIDHSLLMWARSADMPDFFIWGPLVG